MNLSLPVTITLVVLGAILSGVLQRVIPWAWRRMRAPGKDNSVLPDSILQYLSTKMSSIQADVGAICESLSQPNTTLHGIKDLLSEPMAFRSPALDASVERLAKIDAHLEKLVAIAGQTEAAVAESAAQTRGVMRAMMGTGGSADDEVIERAKALKEQYGLSWEEAIRRVREQSTYLPR